MTKEEHAKVLAALEAITKHFSISRLHESTLADTTVRGQAHEAIAIMRKEPQGWMPIETAPKTSKAILVYCAERKNTFTVTWARDEEYPWSGKWKHFVGDLLNAVPTHWMPLPPPPALEKAR